MQSVELTEKALEFLKGVFTAFDMDAVSVPCCFVACTLVDSVVD